ncbi:hypothetical protein SAMN05444000_11835 [Shimia gijangensis]|uniref:Uncharacterized protein n=1 Tax=Shimia gijangensis TaxID=1470563 RepID=A0A1M6PG33_9RHOB|nr:hypothetical protein SAMN05444000_11835 [Shimia gijangensis]
MLDYEYLERDEAGRPPCHPAQRLPAGRQGFTSRGHRLSSLYRSSDIRALTLMARKPASSSCQKYSAGEVQNACILNWGCKTPAASPTIGKCA